MTRSEAIKVLDSIWAKGIWHKTNEIDWNKAGDAIDMATDALKAQDGNKGKWVDENGNAVSCERTIQGAIIPSKNSWCNKCGAWLVASDEYAVSANFCPTCGADMR